MSLRTSTTLAFRARGGQLLNTTYGRVLPHTHAWVHLDYLSYLADDEVRGACYHSEVRTVRAKMGSAGYTVHRERSKAGEPPISIHVATPAVVTGSSPPLHPPRARTRAGSPAPRLSPARPLDLQLANMYTE
jgi:hypothetical protein